MIATLQCGHVSLAHACTVPEAGALTRCHGCVGAGAKPTLFKDLSAKLEAHAHAFKLTDVSYKCAPSRSMPNGLACERGDTRH